MKVVHCGRESHTHYIGRPSVLGNPFSHHGSSKFPVILVGSRSEAIAKFEQRARGSKEILDAIRKLPEDAVLGCWCHPLPCHGDVIITIWKELHQKQPALL